MKQNCPNNLGRQRHMIFQPKTIKNMDPQNERFFWWKLRVAILSVLWTGWSWLWLWWLWQLWYGRWARWQWRWTARWGKLWLRADHFHCRRETWRHTRFGSCQQNPLWPGFGRQNSEGSHISAMSQRRASLGDLASTQLCASSCQEIHRFPHYQHPKRRHNSSVQWGSRIFDRPKISKDRFFFLPQMHWGEASAHSWTPEPAAPPALTPLPVVPELQESPEGGGDQMAELCRKLALEAPGDGVWKDFRSFLCTLRCLEVPWIGGFKALTEPYPITLFFCPATGATWPGAATQISAGKHLGDWAKAGGAAGDVFLRTQLGSLGYSNIAATRCFKMLGAVHFDS